MRYPFILALVIALAGCSQNQETVKKQPIEGLNKYALGTPVSYGNATIVPVLVADAKEKQTGDYMSLSEAKKDGLVEINEMQTGEEVNRLTVKNNGKKPLLLLAGELLLGGKQDRVVAKDTVVPPGTEMSVPVFCVEHGRWEGKDGKFEFSDSMAPQAVRMKASFGEQQEVWDQVSEYNDKAAAPSDTTSVRGGLYNDKIQGRIDTDLSKFVEGLDNQKDVVGVVYVLNGEISSFELFGNEALFKASREPLLKGFLADAAIKNNASMKPLDLPSVEKFIRDSLAGERRQTRLASSAANWSVAGSQTQGVETTLPTAEAKNSPSDLLHGTYKPGN